MPENIRCTECGLAVLGVTVPRLRPVGDENCPNCGGDQFVAL